MVYKSKSQVIDLLYFDMCQVIALLYQSIVSGLSIITAHKKTPSMKIEGVKPKFHQYELQIYIKNPTFLGMGNYEPTTI